MSKTIFEGANICGSGFWNYMTAHGSKVTMQAPLIEAGHGDTSKALWTVHSDINTLSQYHNFL